MKNRCWIVVLIAVAALVTVQQVRAIGQRTSSVQDSGRWEYGTLTVSTQSGDIVAFWYAGNNRGIEASGRNAFNVINGRLGRRGQILNVYQLLTELGSDGWELVNVSGTGAIPSTLDDSVSGIWTFKRATN